jgi:hypothetical protein
MERKVKRALSAKELQLNPLAEGSSPSWPTGEAGDSAGFFSG